MYRVVIIDDEPIIVEGISRMVPWEKYNCRVTATANDGMEGADMIREQKPDIVITDISMPGQSGLEMIAGLRSEFPNMMISILTGYRNFDFAQKAIWLGVTRYLLKPSNMEEIEEALHSMTEKLDEIRNIEKENTEKGKTEAGADENSGSFIVKNALKYIENNYEQKLTLSDVAEKTYVSQWHLSKLLNRHTGKNFSEILNSARIEAAKRMLADPSLRIGEISEKVGFLDMAHFSRVFKKLTGISANEYRQQIGIDKIK